jgi:hypothetical protein
MPRAPVSILDLDADRIIETPWLTASLGYVGGEAGWRSITRVGSTWATFLPDAQMAPQRAQSSRLQLPLRTVDPSGATRPLADSCPPTSTSHHVATVPGALLAYCGSTGVGVR